jgi:hypothetical protein
MSRSYIYFSPLAPACQVTGQLFFYEDLSLNMKLKKCKIEGNKNTGNS